MYLSITPHFRKVIIFEESIKTKFRRVLYDIETINVKLDWEFIVYLHPHLI